MPNWLASVRSTATRKSGVSGTCCRCTSTTPGIAAASAWSRRASARFWAVFLPGPLICTSMGAESPKLSTWVMMSEGAKKNTRSGKRCGSALRNRRR